MAEAPVRIVKSGLVAVGAVALLAALGTVRADSFCMLAAETYYQQLYCEVTAHGRGSLPSFADFKRNTPTVQALLLKRPAQRLGIEVALPQRQRPVQVSVAPDAPPAAPPRAPPAAAAPAVRQPDPPQRLASGMAACRLDGAAITCDTRRFALMGNSANRQLRQGALGEANRMDLPRYEGDLTDTAGVSAYLYRAYGRYVEKMLDIGLGGSTMNYGKFAYLFKDLSEKGVDFVGRFETMYRYLKQDKSAMGAARPARPDKALALRDCGELGEHVIVCARSGRNYVYRSDL